MKIAQVAPLIEAVPPKLYGGTERVVAYLTDALVDLGHEVTLFASGDSLTKAKLAPMWPRSLRLDPAVKDPFVPLFMQLETVARRAHEFDVIHAHIDYFGYPLLQRLGVPSADDVAWSPGLAGVAGALQVLRRRSRGIHLEFAARPLPQANYVATVLHGLPQDLLAKGAGQGGYLAFLGRISPEKAPDAAIRIARRRACRSRSRPRSTASTRNISRPRSSRCSSCGDVEFIGEIREDQKAEFLGNAAALLFPIAWREPFGLVMIESMACGTPVVAFENGSVPEVLEDGVTGFIVHDEQQAVEAVGRHWPSIAIGSARNSTGASPPDHMAQNYVSRCIRGWPRRVAGAGPCTSPSGRTNSRPIRW